MNDTYFVRIIGENKQRGEYSTLREAILACSKNCAVYDSAGDIVFTVPYKLPNANPYPAPSFPLTRGCVGEVVKWLQQALILRGFSCGGAIDGVYGIGTEAAVRALQSVIGLEPTGRADEITIRKLKGDLA